MITRISNPIYHNNFNGSKKNKKLYKADAQAYSNKTKDNGVFKKFLGLLGVAGIFLMLYKREVISEKLRKIINNISNILLPKTQASEPKVVQPEVILEKEKSVSDFSISTLKPKTNITPKHKKHEINSNSKISTIKPKTELISECNGQNVDKSSGENVKADLKMQFLNKSENATFVYDTLKENCKIYKKQTFLPANKKPDKTFEIFRTANPGDKIQFDGKYLYGTTSKELAESATSKNHRGIFYEIFIPKGSKVMRNKDFNDGILLPKNASYILISKSIKQNGTLDVFLQYASKMPNA